MQVCTLALPASLVQTLMPRWGQTLSMTLIEPSFWRVIRTGSDPISRVMKSPGLGISLSWPSRSQVFPNTLRISMS